VGQPLSTGAKVAIGCVAVLFIGGVIVTVLLGGAVWWAKGKAQQVAGELDKASGEMQRIEELQKKANANPFHDPPGGVIDEARLVKFLEVRKRVYQVYKTHEPEIEARKNKKQGDLGDVAAFVGLVNEIRGAQAQAQADLGMSDDEYRFMVHQIYKTMWATQVAKETGGKTVSEAAGEAYDKAARAMQDAAAETREAEARARSRGDDSARELSEEARKAVSEGADELEKHAREVHDGARELDVPASNIALFQKYEADIKKYAMTGMEWLGL
jgi:hypothetical protein